MHENQRTLGMLSTHVCPFSLAQENDYAEKKVEEKISTQNHKNNKESKNIQKPTPKIQNA